MSRVAKTCVVALTLGVVGFFVIGAGPGQNLNRQVTGHIQRLFTGADNALVLVSNKGIALEVMKIGRGCVIHLNGQRIPPEELRVGLIATLHFNDFTRVVYQIDAVTPPFVVEGLIESVDVGGRRLKLANVKQAIKWDRETLMLRNDKHVNAPDLKAGDLAIIQCAAAERNGVITKFDKAEAKMHLLGHRDSLSYEEGWNLFVEDKAVFITQLRVGDKVSARRNLYQAVRIDTRPAPKKRGDMTEEKDMEKEKEKDQEKEKEQKKDKDKDKEEK
jgi:hypothetical protein